jgi:hypothetical protein
MPLGRNIFGEDNPVKLVGKPKLISKKIFNATNFPFDAFEFTEYDKATTPVLKLTSPWHFDLTDAVLTVGEVEIALGGLFEDDTLTPTEKFELKRVYDSIVAWHTNVLASATNAGLGEGDGAYDDYVTAYGALYDYVTPLVADLTSSSSTTGSTLRGKFSTYYEKKAGLEAAIELENAANFTDRPTFAQLFNEEEGVYVPTVPTISLCKGVYQGVVVQWDKQTNLANFARYEVQVSNNDSTWYSLEFDGTDWKDTLNADTDWPVEMLVHNDIPFGGDADDPTGVTLYYRVRRVTLLDVTSAWSSSSSATTLTVEGGTVAENAIYANNIRAGVIQALCIAASDLTVAYYGSGTVDSPSEGDIRLRLYQGTMFLEQYLGGGWSDVNLMKVGLIVGSLYLGLFQGCGLYHPDASTSDFVEPFPTSNFHVIDCETAGFPDQNGDTPDSATNAVQSDTWAAFGSYSLFASAGNRASLEFDDVVTLDANQGFCAKVHCVTLDVTDSMVASFFYTLYGNAGHDLYTFLIYHEDTEELIGTIIEDVSVLAEAKISISKANMLGSDHSVGLVVDYDNSILYILLDNEIATDTIDTRSITGASTTNYIKVHACNAWPGGYGAPPDTEVTFYQDDICFAWDDACNPDLFVKHYLSGQPWSTTVTYTDLPLKAATGGKIPLLSDTSIAGQLTITGASRSRATQNTGQSITDTTLTSVVFNTQTEDNLGEYDSVTGVFTALEAGTYSVKSSIMFANVAWAAGKDAWMAIYKNGAIYSVLDDFACQANFTDYLKLGGSDEIELLSDDYFDIRVYHNRGAATALHNNGAQNYVSIHRLS